MAKIFFVLLSIVVLVSCKKEIVAFDNDPDSQFELPLILALNGKNACFDSENNLLKYSLDETDLDNFAPFVHFQAKSALVFEGKNLQNNAVNDFGDLELHKTYSLEITTGKQTKVLKLVFTIIPVIQLVTFDEIPNEPKALARMTINYPESAKFSQTDWIGIEQRGASSLAYDKKSYGLTVYSSKSTSNPVLRSYFDFNPGEDWILDAMFVDVSRLRNKASFELWSSMGTGSNHCAIHSKFVEVFLNSQSIGLYCFNENFTKQTLNLNSSSVYYRGTDNSTATYFEKVPSQETNAVKWGEWEQKYPKPSKQINWTDFKALTKFIVESSDPEFKNNIGGLIDLDNVVDYYLFINLCAGYDNVGKNWGFLKRNPSDKFTIVPWDLDATWGRNAFGLELTNSALVTNNFFSRLTSLNPENFNQRVHERWNELRSNQFSQASLTQLFESNVNELSSYRMIESENDHWHQSLDLLLEKSYIQFWISNRLNLLDNTF